MTAIRFFTDEHVCGAIAPALCRAGFDAVSTPGAGRLRESDDSQFLWASDQGRVLVSFNVAHFAGVHAFGCGKADTMPESWSPSNDRLATCCAV